MPKTEKLIEAKEWLQFILAELLANPEKTTDHQKKQLVLRLRLLISTILKEEEDCPQIINWLAGWPDFDFRNLTPDEILSRQRQVEAYIKQFMFENGITSKITFVWVEDPNTPGRFRLKAFLCPPPEVVDPGGPGGGTMDPEKPPPGG